MKHTIKSLNDQMINAKDSGIINWKELFNNERNGAVSDSNTEFEFDDTKPNEIVFIHCDANGKLFRIEFSLPIGVTYQNVLDIIKPYFEKTNQ
jgi:hypothetical protein